MIDDVWFAPGLSRRDLLDCLHALSIPEHRHPPLVAMSASPDGPPAVILASGALLALFEAPTPEELAMRMLAASGQGSRSLDLLRMTLPLDGAPRLDRLRFSLGPGSESLTLLCRRTMGRDRTPIFIAAAVGLGSASRRDLAMPSVATGSEPARSDADLPEPVLLPHEPAGSTATIGAEPLATPAGAMTIQAIQSMLRLRWPGNRSLRFLWQTDAGGICRSVTPPLAEIVGAANADLVGRDLHALAPLLDPSGRLSRALAASETWSGLEVDWPLADAPAGVAVSLGAIPVLGRDGLFDGFSGYGVIRLDRVAQREPMEPWQTRPDGEPQNLASNVVEFRAASEKTLSPEDKQAFDALASELRDKAGLSDDPSSKAPPEDGAGPEDAGPSGSGEAEPALSAIAAPAGLLPSGLPIALLPADALPGDALPGDLLPAETRLAEHAPADATVDDDAASHRADAIARNGLAMLDRLPIGLLVSRDNVPIFANRHSLDLLGFSDEDDLHGVGGMAHLFGGQPGNNSGAESVGIRARDGRIVPVTARMRRIDWDGLPATLLTLHGQPDRSTSLEGGAATGTLEELRREADAGARREIDLIRREEIAAKAQQENQSSHEAYRSRTEGDLRELRAILETATDGVAVIDAACNVLSLNRSGEALFGCDRGAVIGRPFVELFTADNQSLAADYIEGLKSDATRSLLNDGREILIKAQQGGSTPVFMTLGRLPGGETDGLRFCALFRDLTHWKKVESDLETARRGAERASTLKSEFLAKVSHEVRTPLNAIIGFAEIIMQERFGPFGSGRYMDYIRDIHASGTHVMSLVNDLLDLSKIEAGKMELAVAPTDLNRIVSDCVALMQPEASRERVIMRLSLAPTLPSVQADERSLRQIVLNILSNGVRYNEPGGQVIVATACAEGGRVTIRIRDTGPGMSETDIAAALEPFRQLSPSRHGSGGTGLGLPLTKALVEANHASFTIRSKVDQGTLVEVAFPPASVLAD